MKKMPNSTIAIMLFLLLSLGSTIVSAAEYDTYYHAQALLGRLIIEEGDGLFESSSGEDPSYFFEGDKLKIPILGVSVQQKLGGHAVDLGVEGGGLFSWKSDQWRVTITNNTANIKISNSMFLADLFFGGFAAKTFKNNLRLYLGAGPLIIYGYQDIDPEENSQGATKDTISDWDVGLYARTGIEYIFREDLIAGIGVRFIHTQLDLKNPGGKTEVEGVQVLFTLAATLKPHF